eukprot:gene688-6227_t
MVFEDVNHTYCYGCARYWLEISSGTNISSFRVSDINIDHITLVAAVPDGFGGGILAIGGNKMQNVNITNSILPTGKYGVWPSDIWGCALHRDSPKARLDDCFDPYVFNGNLMIQAADYIEPKASYPAGNVFLANASAIHYDPK